MMAAWENAACAARIVDARFLCRGRVSRRLSCLHGLVGGLPLLQEWNKAHLINRLAEVHGYRHYLELCTFSTGRRYAEIDRSKLETCVRLMYGCPDDFDDGLSIDHRSNTLDIGESLK
jgi:hypothetical protein